MPRWTTYPALGVLIVVAIIALPGGRESSRGAATRVRGARVALTGSSGTAGTSGTTGGASTATDQKSYTRSVVEFLPPGYVTDGSVDYRVPLQTALDASAGGSLVLPDFPIRVGKAPGQNYALLVRSGLRLSGSRNAELVAGTGSIQLLRAQGTRGLVLEGFTLRGIGGDGANLAHGLLQITGGSDVRVSGLCVVDADADGIAISAVRGVIVEGCTVAGASKSALYLNACEGGVLRGNLVRDFGGHLLAGGARVGAGIQLSSNVDVVCSENVITDGAGIGILCNANSAGAAPSGNVLRGNRIARVNNPTNINVSGGIRCANGAAYKATLTLVSGNSILDCGAYGIYVENHGSSAIVGNLIARSERSGLLVSSIQDLQVQGNVILSSDQARKGGQAAIYLLNNAQRVRCTDNVLRNTQLLGASSAVEGIIDASQGGGHSLEPRIEYAAAAPTGGSWRLGDRVYNSEPAPGEALGWVCTSPGQPGLWSSFGAIGTQPE